MDIAGIGSRLVIQRIVVEGDGIRLDAVSVSRTVRCPTCGIPSQRVHDRYVRRPADLPWRGRSVSLAIQVRRFRCGEASCPRATFAEDLGSGLRPRGQRTEDVTAFLLAVVRLIGAEAGARFAITVGIQISADTLLRRQRSVALSDETPRVLGVDDLALRRGNRYATLLMDRETHRPVDLLAGRDADVLATGLRDHPGVEVIVRDRSTAYAEGARLGAPNAVQVADRFHLARNASAAFDELIRGRRRLLDVTRACASRAGVTPAARPRSATAQRDADRRAARIERWERTHALRADGLSIRRIAAVVGIERRTVRGLLASPLPPRNQIVAPRPPPLASPTLHPFAAYLRDRWQAGCHNMSQLYREILAQEYGGSASLLRQALRPWRPPRAPPRACGTMRRLSARWLCLRPPELLGSDETIALAVILDTHRDLAIGYDLLTTFRAVLRRRDVADLDPWIACARQSGLPSFVALDNGIAADRAAVDAALTLPWSNGPVEGYIHKVKLIKRQGYGRAAIALLRARVLAA
ncbi:MAG: ISL3 family transposase [Chloroflexota bacterium]|nr:MAG: ISL3 family transposase [Chloroflexota bacterium]